MRDTKPYLIDTDFPALRRGALQSLQVNLGYLCNMSCSHCHVNAGPQRTELMSREIIDLVLAFIDENQVQQLDLTGGAPEMNPHFCYLVREARKRDVEVIDRCNLTILLEPEYHHMAQFLAEQQVRIVASLPCYSAANVDQQRGKGVFDDSVAALQKLNALGYATHPALKLDLVYNPNGSFLPPPQASLEADYKRELQQHFAIAFNQLLTIANMPISRFGATLLAHNEFDSYLSLLKQHYSADNLATVMCRHLISIDWRGFVYDCDFNQMLDMPLQRGDIISSDNARPHLRDLLGCNSEDWPIAVGEHCYGCTAGQGSSCSGALA